LTKLPVGASSSPSFSGSSDVHAYGGASPSLARRERGEASEAERGTKGQRERRRRRRRRRKG
jgi:hypothetical protein